MRAGAATGVVALVVGGCAISQITSPFRSKSEPETWAPAVSEARLLEAARSDTTGRVEMVGVVTDCPAFRVWPSDKLLTVYEIGQVGDSMAIVYRGEITKTARECQVLPNKVVVKYGVAGRVLLGPKGKPGPVSLPMQVQVTDRTRKVISSQKLKVAVSMSLEDPVGYFSTVNEIPITLPVGSRPADFEVFVAFDRSHPGAG